MSTGPVFRPGQLVPISGQYGAVNVHGRYLGRETTCSKGERFPPVFRHRGEYGWKLTDRTVHRRY